MNRIVYLAMSSLLAVSAAAQESATNSLGMELVPVREGVFRMGRPAGGRFQEVMEVDHPRRYGSDEAPSHLVAITKPFWIAKHEVTVGQFAQFVEATGYVTTAEKSGRGAIGWLLEPGEPIATAAHHRPFEQKAECSWKSPGFAQTPRHPVVCVSWEDAQAFCRWLSEKENATYRLPTEAEWEYAAQAQSDTIYHFGDEYRGQIHRFANIADADAEAAHRGLAMHSWYVNGPGDGAVCTAEVGRYAANPWGLHDTLGNVWEWCQDRYDENAYSRAKETRNRLREPVFDPVVTERWNPAEGYDWRNIRGGAWNVSPGICRAQTRAYLEAKEAACYVGFRVIREGSAEQLAAGEAWAEKWKSARQVVFAAPNSECRAEGGNWLSVSFFRGAPDGIFARLPDLPRLRFLRFDGRDRLTPEVIGHIAKIPALRSLEIYNCDSGAPAEAYAQLAALDELTGLALSSETNLTPELLRTFPCLPRLTRLRFGNPNFGDAEILAALTEVEFSRLETLNLEACQANGTSLSAFRGAPLRELRLNRLNDEGAALAAQFSGLEILIAREPQLTGAGLAQLARLPKLRELGLARLDGLGDADLATLGSMKQLTELNLGGSQAGDATAAALRGLVLLELTIGNPNLTDEGMKHIGSIASLRQRLVIGESAKVTEAGIRHLWAPKWLEDLSLQMPSGITGKNFDVVADLPRLRRIHIASRDFTDEGLRYLGYLPQLQQVTLGTYRGGGPAGVTDAGLLLLAEAPKLRTVEIHRGSAVTEAGIARFKEVRPQVEVKVQR